MSGVKAFCILLVALAVGSLPRSSPAQMLIAFDGLDTEVGSCTNSHGTFTLGEVVTAQFDTSGVMFSTNDFGVAHASTGAATGGGDEGTSGDPVLAVNTVDESGCPVARTGNPGVLTVLFVNPVSGDTITASEVGFHLSDSEKTVRARTLDADGNVLHECLNAFSDCTYRVNFTSDIGAFFQFPGDGIARLELIDEASDGRADGFVVDDLTYGALATSTEAAAPGAAGLRLRGNHPNPFESTTEITFYVASPQHVRLSVYDVLGKELVVLVDETVEAGEHRVRHDFSVLPSGLLFCRLKAGNLTEARTMLLLK